MNHLPHTENPQVVRTDFSNSAAWEKACSEIRKPYGEYGAGVEFIDRLEYKDLDKGQVLERIPEKYNHDFIVLFDRLAAEKPGFPLLIVDVSEKPGREFRADPSQIFTIASNLETANMWFYEFAKFVDEEGIYRGFPLTMEDVEPLTDEAAIASMLASYPVSPPPKTLDIRQHIRYWITRLLLNAYKKKLQE